uniref:Uncharacterized protein n=1 Tax=Anopheles melas TaxID=34690 RepID=A0A182TE44_9DIPT
MRTYEGQGVNAEAETIVPPVHTRCAIRNEYRKMMNSRNANMFGAAPSGRNVAGPPLSPIDSVTELRDTLLRAAPSITLLLSMSSSSSSLPAAARSTLVSDSVTYRFRFWNSTFATFVLPTKLHERISLYDFVMFGANPSRFSVPCRVGVNKKKKKKKGKEKDKEKEMQTVMNGFMHNT